MTNSTLRQGICTYLLASVTLGVILCTYLFNGSERDIMDLGGWCYYVTSCLTHALLLLLPALLLFYVPMALLGFRARTCLIPFLTVCGLEFVMAIANRYVFNLYHFHINGLVISMLTSPGAADIFVFSTSMYVKIAGFILLIAALCAAIAYVGGKWATLQRRHFYRPIWIACLSVVLLSQALHIYGSATMKTSIVVSTETIPYYFPIRMNSLLTRMGIIDKQETNQIQFHDTETALAYPLRPLQVERPDSMPNIVILCIDSWNPRTMTPECTPNIYRFARHAEWYTQHLSSSNGTRGGIFGMFTGLSAYYWKSFEFSNTQPILISQLLRAGYHVQAYPSATLKYPPFAKMIFGKVKGLNIETKGATSYDRDVQLTRNFLADLDRYDGKRPFFSFLFYDAAHAIQVPKDKQYRFQPCWETADYMKLSNDTDPTPFFNLYRNCVAEADSLIGLALDKLQQKHLLSNTIVIITGDHGQEFNENHNNYWGHSSNYSHWQTAIPLVYYYPGCRPARHRYRTTHYDLSPTLLHQALGVKNPPADYSMGHYLTDHTPRDWHLVGSDLYYAFIRTDGTIIEKQGAGNIRVMDTHMRTIGHYPLNAVQLNRVINDMNRFYRKK